MSYMNDELGYSLDMYITGHYGEDQFSAEDRFFDHIEHICLNCPIQKNWDECEYFENEHISCPIVIEMIRSDQKQANRYYDSMFDDYKNDVLKPLGRSFDPVTMKEIWIL